MEALIEILDKQLTQASVSIQGACHRLTVQLQQATADDIKALHFCLPKLLSVVLYSVEPSRQSWQGRASSQADFDSLFQLLSPSGPLFSVLIAHSHKAVYDVAENQFPFCLKKALVEGKSSATIASVYKDRLVTKPQSNSHVLRLDMAEYFLFYLLSIVFLPKEQLAPSAGASWLGIFDGKASQSRQVVVNDLVALRSTSSLPNKFSHSANAELYLLLLDQYYKFLLPLSNEASNKNLFTSKQAIHHAHSVRCSEFFMQSSIDCLLQVSSYDIDEHTKKPRSHPQITVNLDQVLATQKLVEHMTNACFIPAHNYAVQGLIEAALPNYKVLLYRQLRLLLNAWPLDNTLAIYMELWMTAAFPWRVCDDKFLVGVGADQLLLHDYHIYHTIFDELLNCFCSIFHSFSQLDAHSVDQQALCEQTEPLIAAFLDVLLNIERILPHLKVFELDIVSSFNKSPNAKLFNEQLQAREPRDKFVPSLLFVGDTGRNKAACLAGLLDQCGSLLGQLPSAGNAKSWIEQAIELLKLFFEFQQPMTVKKCSLNDQQHVATTKPARRRHISAAADPTHKMDVIKLARPVNSNQLTASKKGELKCLVRVFECISIRLNAAMHHRLDHLFLIGTIAKQCQIDLRALAIPGNLLLALFLLLLVGYVAFRMLKSMIWSVFY